MIKKIKIDIAQQFLDDLKAKLRLTRWPDEIEHSGWTYGASLSYMKELEDYWVNYFDWRKTEGEINSCLLYTSDAADEEDSVDLGGRRIIKKKKKKKKQ